MRRPSQAIQWPIRRPAGRIITAAGDDGRVFRRDTAQRDPVMRPRQSIISGSQKPCMASGSGSAALAAAYGQPASIAATAMPQSRPFLWRIKRTVKS